MVASATISTGEDCAGMSQLRQDPLTGRWVILAAGRRNRPNEFPLHSKKKSSLSECPFCPGQEASTTPEIVALGRPTGAPANSSGWSLRCFPNLYPALSHKAADQDSEQAVRQDTDSLFRHEPGLGAHEVIAYSPDHEASLGSLSRENLVALLRVLQDRYARLSEDPQHQYILQFVNHGPEAGATLAHPHLQILATPFVPATVLDKQTRMNDHRKRAGRCLVCDLLAAEELSKDRLVIRDEFWTVLTPWASRFPWEMLLIPRRCQGSILEADAAELESLADALGGALRRLNGVHESPAWNVILHGAPLVGSDASGFHWHLEICPRVSRLAGFEAGTGFAINSIAPEEAAVQLREKED
jgi:UDPglucose--hexose-1-phosphate uridylyltransferase